MVHCFVGCSAGDVYAAIRRKGQRLEPTDTARQPDKGTLEYRRQQADKAAWLWGQRRPLAGSIAEQYLRGARNYSGLLPPTLAFMPARKSDQHPAMIAAFALVDEPEPGQLGKPTEVGSVHLTLLKPDGSGKASTKPDKLIIGSPVGKPIVLAPPNDLLGLAITEGIEDALSAHEATGLGALARRCCRLHAEARRRSARPHLDGDDLRACGCRRPGRRTQTCCGITCTSGADRGDSGGRTMKARPDINDTLRSEGPAAVRARHDQAHKANGKADALTINETLDVFNKWLILDNPMPVLAVLGTVAANLLPGDPVWLGLIAPPSSAKPKSSTAYRPCLAWCRPQR